MSMFYNGQKTPFDLCWQNKIYKNDYKIALFQIISDTKYDIDCKFVLLCYNHCRFFLEKIVGLEMLCSSKQLHELVDMMETTWHNINKPLPDSWEKI